MRRVLMVIAIFGMSFALVGCDEEPAENETPDAETSEEETESDSADEAEDDATDEEAPAEEEEAPAGDETDDEASSSFDYTVTALATSLRNADYCDATVTYANNTDSVFNSMNIEIEATVEGADPIKFAVNLSDVEPGATGEALPTGATSCESLAGAAYAIADGVANCAIDGDYTVSFDECGGYATLTVALEE